MNTNDLTIKAQQVLEGAFHEARNRKHQAVEPGHILHGLMDKGSSVLDFVLNRIGTNKAIIEKVVDKELDSYPKVEGGEPYLSAESTKVLQFAQKRAQKQGDQFVSVELILLGLLELARNNFV